MKRKIIQFFEQLIIHSILFPGKMGFGRPASGLMDYIRENGSILQFVEEMEKEAQANPFSQEYRLNGAGLKMVWEWNLSKSKIKISIGGDQKEYYPEFMRVATVIIKEFKFDKEVY